MSTRGGTGVAGLETLHSLAALERAELVWVEGEDAATFLNGLLTSDVSALGDGDSQRSLLLDAKGRLRALVRVHRSDAEAYTLVLQPEAGDKMMADLERFHFSERLELIGPEPVSTLVASEPAAVAMSAGAELEVVGWVEGTVELAFADPSAALTAIGREPSPPDALDALRIETGTPLLGRDLGEATLVHEAGLERAAVSFTKGCYLGQETVARVEHRGKVNRRLRAVLLQAKAPEGTPVLRGDSVVGALGTVARVGSWGWAGLAVLRVTAEPGSEVEVAGGAARVTTVPLSGGAAPHLA